MTSLINNILLFGLEQGGGLGGDSVGVGKKMRKMINLEYNWVELFTISDTKSPFHFKI